jgi:hypothetical protein
MHLASRFLRSRQTPRRHSLSTAPAPPSFPPQTRFLRIPLIAGSLAFTAGLGFYILSHSSAAEVQSSKTWSASDNSELTASAGRKEREKEGKAEMSANKAGGSPRDPKAAKGVRGEKPESGASQDSRTEKVKSGHDDSEQPNHERTRKEKSGGKSVGKSEQKEEEKKGDAKEKKEGTTGAKEDGEEPQGAVGTATVF